MGYNFRPVERDQQYLMPPSLRDWLPADDLAWFVLDAVDQLDSARSTPATGPTVGARRPSSRR